MNGTHLRFQCKGSITGPDNALVRCPEFVSPMPPTKGVASLELKPPQEFRLKCARGHVHDYAVAEANAGVGAEGEKGIAHVGVPGTTPPAGAAPIIDKDYWLKQGAALIENAHGKLMEQVQSLDKYIVALSSGYVLTTIVGSIYFGITENWHYVVLLIPVVLVNLGHWYCTQAQLPKPVEFSAESWEQCKAAIEHYVNKGTKHVRTAKVLSAMAMLGMTLAICFVTKWEVEAKKNKAVEDLTTERDALKKSVTELQVELTSARASVPAFAGARYDRVSKKLEMKGYFPANRPVLLTVAKGKELLLLNSPVAIGPHGRFNSSLTVQAPDTLIYLITYSTTTGGPQVFSDTLIVE